MSELDRVNQMHSNLGEGSRILDEVRYDPATRSIGSSSSSDPDDGIHITKPDADLFFNNWRQ